MAAAVACALCCAQALALDGAPSGVKAGFVLVVDESTGEVLYDKNAAVSVPIASISKLMSAVVTLDAGLPGTEMIEIDAEDVQATWPNGSRLSPGVMLSREDLLHLALLASDNRAAVALGRTYPGGMPAFVAAMNHKAEELGMTGSHFVEPSGLSKQNVSTAHDLVRLMRVAKDYPLIAYFSTDAEYTVSLNGRPATFHNTNALVRAGDPEIAVQKTGFTNAAGQCVVMYLKAAARTLSVVLLGSVGRYGPVLDATRIRTWAEEGYVAPAAFSRMVAYRPAAPAKARAVKATTVKATAVKGTAVKPTAVKATAVKATAVKATAKNETHSLPVHTPAHAASDLASS